MSLAVSQREKIVAIFSGNEYKIPLYQRRYSWTDEQVKQLWDDLNDARKKDISHYFGTLIFKERESPGLSTLQSYEIIDGQQRLTTIFILLNELINKLPDSEKKDELRKIYIGYPSKIKIDPLGQEDSEFLSLLMFNFNSVKETSLEKRSHKLMFKAKRYFCNVLTSHTPEEVERILSFILTRLETLVLVVNKPSEAIRMFEIINDRGLPLNILDKTKSKLMLYSTIYLEEQLNQDINEAFQIVYDSDDDILNIKEELEILGQFGQNTLFTHHYLSSRDLFKETWNYRNSAEKMFKNIQTKCESLYDKKNDLRSFIRTYIEDLSSFSRNYANLLKEIKVNKDFIKPFQFLEFTATLYPLIVRLYSQNKLNHLLDILEKIELRVYKCRNNRPVADVYYISSQVVENDIPIEELRNSITVVKNRFSDDLSFKTILSSGEMYENNATKYILLEYNNSLDDRRISNIKEYKELQKEHIFSRNPKFDVESYGFSKEEYPQEINKIGNLTLFEPDNNDNPPQDKADAYLQSSVYMTNILGGQIKQHGFNKNDVDDRTNKFINFCINRF